MVSVDVSTETSLNREKAKDRMAKAMESTVRSGETIASNNAPVDTGRLKNSISFRKFSRFKYGLVAGVKYASAVEFGTDSHTITPDTAQALFWEGADHPVKKVEHPGTPSQPFMRPALQHMIDVAPRKFEIYMKQ
jgi:HK97 gp10 family phage protein